MAQENKTHSPGGLKIFVLPVKAMAPPTLKSSNIRMSPWQRWLHRPQSVWVRKAFFQVHLWTGIGIGLYVLVISISGSAVVYRRELMRRFPRKEITVVVSGRRLNAQELMPSIERVYPGYEILSIREPAEIDRPDEVILQGRQARILRLFDPYTGANLGNPESSVDLILRWLVDLHDNLLAGQAGRTANGIGAFLITLLGLTGCVLWWPGKKNWRRAVAINTKARFPRLNWDVHSATGFWCSLFVLVWGSPASACAFPERSTPLRTATFSTGSPASISAGSTASPKLSGPSRVLRPRSSPLRAL